MSTPLQMIDRSLTLRKPVDALVLVPTNNRLSPLGRKLYNVLLYVAQTNLRNMDGIPPATYMFSAPLLDLLRVCNAEQSFSTAKQYLQEMRESSVVWDSPDSNAELQHKGFQLVSEAQFTKKNGVVMLHWALPPTIVEMLADPYRWANIDLLVMLKLQSYVSLALYDVCAKYRTNPSRLTCRRDVDWWCAILSSTPAAIDPETGKRKVQEWRKFKNKHLNSAIEEINEKSDLHITLHEFKEGKAIRFVQFEVEPKNNDARSISSEAGRQLPMNPDAESYAKRLGLTNMRELRGHADKHGTGKVLEALLALEARQAQQELDLVKSPAGYLRFLLDGDEANTLAPEDVRQVDRIERDIIPAQPNITQAAAIAKARRLAEAELPSTPMDYALKRRQEVLLELTAMEESELRGWIKSYMEALSVQGMLTPAVKNRLNSKDWKVGMAKAGLVNFYGTTKYGQGWLIRPQQEI